MKEDRLKKILGMLESDPEDSFLRYAVAKEYESQIGRASCRERV